MDADGVRSWGSKTRAFNRKDRKGGAKIAKKIAEEIAKEDARSVRVRVKFLGTD
jgi:hypothetical protein